MGMFKDRTGERYGKLLVIEHRGKDLRGKHLWLCKCDCGNYKVVVSDNLSSGKSKSCGCRLREFLARKGNQFAVYTDRRTAILKLQYARLRRRHKKFNGEFLSYEDFVEKSESPCWYCGLEWSREVLDRRNDSIKHGLISDVVVKCNGIDRIDSKIGYTAENTIPCCKHCNTAKNTMSQEEFRNWVIKIYDHYIAKVVSIEKENA